MFACLQNLLKVGFREELIYEIAEKWTTPWQPVESYHPVSSSKTKTNRNKNEYGHDLMSATHKISDHHLHHEEKWQAAMTSHWLHQLLMVVGVDDNPPYILGKLLYKISASQ
jgi:hypothetical protein